MRANKNTLGAAIIAGASLLAGAGAVLAQSVTLTATKQSTTLSDGNTVPMWGWACGSGAAAAAGGATCTAASGSPQTGGTTWQPPVITVPAGSGLTVTLNNTLPVETSLAIIGQLGTGATSTGVGNPVREGTPRVHNTQTSTTWPTVTTTATPFTPPAQAQRTRSFTQEAPAGTNTTPGSVVYQWTHLQPGTYLIETGTYPSIQAPMGLYGVLVVTTAPTPPNAANSTAFAPGTAYPGLSYDADAVLLLSEIDPVQNIAVDAAVGTTGFSETAVWNAPCGAAHTCYPPAVDYTPLYYLVNGVSFDPASPGVSTLQLPTSFSTGNVLLRLVNAGLHAHSPAAVSLPMALIAQDGNVEPDVAVALGQNPPLTPKPKIQNEVFMAAGKVYDVFVHPATNGTTSTTPTAYSGATYQVFDRALGLSANNRRDSGMQTYVQMGAAAAGAAGGVPAALNTAANPDFYTLAPNLTTFSANVLANDVGIKNATLAQGPAHGTVVLNPNGTFIYTPAGSTYVVSDAFTYFGNGTVGPATVTLTVGAVSGAPTANTDAYNSNVATLLKVARPGVLANDTDPATLPLTAVLDACTVGNCLSSNQITLNADGSFTANPTSAGTYTFRYHAVNSQGTPSSSATVTINFTPGSNLQVSVFDAQSQAAITDYKWVIEEDTTYHTPVGASTPPPAQTLATSFHKSYMPVVASGCTGQFSCGSGQTVYNPVTAAHDAVAGQPPTTPDQVALDPNKYYYISVLPGDAADAFVAGGGNPVTGPVALAADGTTITATLPAASQPGVSAGDQIIVASATSGYGGTFTVTGVTATTFSYVVSNAPAVATATGTYTRGFVPALDCTFKTGSGNCGHTMGGAPIPAPTAAGLASFAPVTVKAEPNPLPASQLTVFVFEDNNPTNGDIDGVEAQQGLGGFQVILNDVAGATGITIGQMTYDMFNMPLSNALNGQTDGATRLNACFISPSTPVGVILTCPEFEYDSVKQSYTTVRSPLAGMAQIKNLFPNRFDVLAHPGADREAAGEEWLQSSTLEGTHANDAFAKLGEPAYFQEFGPPGWHSFIGFVNPAHIKAVNDSLKGTHTVAGTITNLHMSRPSSEALYDSQSHTPLAQTQCYVGLNSQNGIGATVAFSKCDANGKFLLTGVPNGQYQLAIWDQWQDQIFEFQSVAVIDANVNMGTVPVFSWFQSLYTRTFIDNGADNPGLLQVPMQIRFRDGQFSNSLLTDSHGNAVFNELFPLFNWYVMESDNTRYKGTKIQIVNDGGGKVDTTDVTGPDGTTFPTTGVLNSTESFPLPANLQVPGALYTAGKAVRNDPGSTLSEGFQAFISQPQIVNWGKTPYLSGENGGIIGHVVYASTRPFDDPNSGSQNLWEPLVPGVTVNLYQKSTAADGTQILTLVDTSVTTSWDAWANGVNAATGQPNMNCPGQDPTDPYYTQTLGAGNQYKCYDGFHNWNQVQPAPYDGRYQFPTKNCRPSVCTQPNPNTTAAVPLPNLLPPGRYVAEVVVPPGFEIVKEEDKNILIGDNYIAPVTQQFASMGNIYIVPDQAAINTYNANNPNNPTNNLGRTTFGGFNAGGVIVQPAPCAGRVRIVPDFMSIAPQSGQAAPFAGASRPLCDRREVVLEDQMQAKADFFVFTPTPKAAKFTGIILDDLSSEFNTTKPDFGEKFSVPFVPVSFRDFNGVEISRMHADQFGTFNGLVYSTWEVNPPNPTGYAPNMMITCMNDPGPVLDTNPTSSTYGQMITDPLYNPHYSNFCYTNAYMPGTTDYMDTPVLPVAAFAAGYNPADCSYPDTTPAIRRVDGDGQFGPWAKAVGSTVTITALGDAAVPNNAYEGPAALNGLASKATITRHYGFGATAGSVTVGGVPLNNVNWGDLTITGTIPANLPACPNSTDGSQCGELVITTASGRATIDAVTVTVGGKPPIYVNPPSPSIATSGGLAHPIQDAIDQAAPGDLIMLNGAVNPNVPVSAGVNPCLAAATNCGVANYPELVIMWKPVRLQGVGAASVLINAAKYPTQKLQDWRKRINTLFGLDSQGNTLPGVPQTDPLPGQEITGGIVNLEPSVLATEEGAGITVLAKNQPKTQCAAAGASAGNFLCAPARIDGVSITGGDAGGGVYVNGWAHGLEVSNNRVYGNAGTYTGGIRIGQPYLEGLSGTGPFGFNANVNIHNNAITENGTVEANNGNGGAGGGLSLNAGSDNYAVTQNYVCGNFALGDGGGIGHLGLSQNGRIAQNTIIFNQSYNQSSATSGGGLVVAGETGTGTALSLGTGNLKVDSNLIVGNHAGGGFGGGVRLQDVNGADVAANPNSPAQWWRVSLTNNMISNNVAGWAGGGMSLENTALSYLINNTIVTNDSTSTAAGAFGTSRTATQFAPAGVVAELHSPALAAAFGSGVPASLKTFSNPVLENNIIYRNRAFRFEVTSGPGSGANPGAAATTRLVPVLAQSATGQCPAGAHVWDLGVLGERQNNPVRRLNPTYSILTSTDGGYDGNGTNSQDNPRLTRLYCNGPRANPGIPDSTPPNPPFTIQVAGTEDEGGNWVDVRYGPLSLSDSSLYTNANSALLPLADYHLLANSPAIDTGSSQLAPDHDFYGNTRPQGEGFDMGGHEFPQRGNNAAALSFTPALGDFGNQRVRTRSAAQTFTVTNNGNANARAIKVSLTGANLGNFNIQGNTCGGALKVGAACAVTVAFTPSALGLRAAVLSVRSNESAVHAQLTGNGK